jgi:hypothetical protein
MYTPTKENCIKDCQTGEELSSIHVINYRDSSLTRKTFYIGVKAAVPDSTNSAQYIIRTMLNADQLKPPTPGNDGKIGFLNIATPGAIKLSFEAAVSPKSHIKPEQLRYAIYYSEAADKVVMFSFCGLQTKANMASNFTGLARGTTYTGTILNLVYKREYVVNVIVTDPEGERTVYRMQSVTTAGQDDIPNPNDGTPIGTYVGIGGAVIGVLVIGVAVLFYRNRKLSKELEVEMHDVPKESLRKAMRGPPTGTDVVDDVDAKTKQKKYHKLLTDDDEDYVPPETEPSQL